jgi:hypothetical protein
MGARAEKALPDLVKGLKSDFSTTRRTCCFALSGIGPSARKAIPDLIKALGDSDGGVRANAVRALGNIGPEAPEAVRPLRKLLLGMDWTVRNEALVALGKIGPAARVARPELVAAMKLGSVPAAEALWRIEGSKKETFAAIVSQLQAPYEHQQKEAAAALGRIGRAARTTARALQRALLDEPSLGLRIAVAEALWKVTGKTSKVIPVLIGGLKDPDHLNRVAALRVLKEMGPKAKAAVPSLKELAKEEEGVWSRPVLDTLKKIVPRK